MNCLPLLANVEGKLSDWARGILRKRERRKTKFRNAIKSELRWDWFHAVLFSPQKAIWLNWKIHVTIVWTLKVSGSLHSDQAVVSHWLLVETSVPTFLCHWGLISPINFLGCSHPYLYFLRHVCDIFDHLFSVFSSCNSLFSVPASLYRCRELSVQQRHISQPEHLRITASTRRTLVLFPPHQTSCVLPSGLMTTQWRRAVEYGWIKQRRFALVKCEVRKGHPWLMGLWPSQIALVQKQKQHNFVFFC